MVKGSRAAQKESVQKNKLWGRISLAGRKERR